MCLTRTNTSREILCINMTAGLNYGNILMAICIKGSEQGIDNSKLPSQTSLP